MKITKTFDELLAEGQERARRMREALDRIDAEGSYDDPVFQAGVWVGREVERQRARRERDKQNRRRQNRDISLDRLRTIAQELKQSRPEACAEDWLKVAVRRLKVAKRTISRFTEREYGLTPAELWKKLA